MIEYWISAGLRPRSGLKLPGPVGEPAAKHFCGAAAPQRIETVRGLHAELGGLDFCGAAAPQRSRKLRGLLPFYLRP